MTDIHSFLKEIPLNIRQVEALTGVNKYTLRFWEHAFRGYLDPGRTTGKQRCYTMEDVRRILEIKKLLKIELYTIQGAQKKIGLPRSKKRLEFEPPPLSARPLPHSHSRNSS
jgi:DNA-binding transcriptional MerR regulator